MKGQRTLVEGVAVEHDDEELEGGARDLMLHGDADAVLDEGIGHGGILDLGGRNLEASDIDDIILTTGEMQHPLVIETTEVGGEEGVVAQHGGCALGIADVTGHEGVTLTGDGALLGDEEVRVGHRMAERTGLAATVVEVVGTDDAGLGGGVGVIEPRVGQQAAERLHVGLRDGSGAGLDEVHAVGKGGQTVGTELNEDADAGGHEEGGIARRDALDTKVGAESIEEGVDILEAIDEDEGGTEHHHGVDLGEAADVVQGTVDDEGEVVAEALTGDEVLGIGDDGVVADEHALGLSGGAGGVEDIGRTLGDGMPAQLLLHSLKGGRRHIALHRRHGEAGTMEGEIADEEVNGSGSAEADERAGPYPATVREGRLELCNHLINAAVELGIGAALIATDDSDALGVAVSVQRNIGFETFFQCFNISMFQFLFYHGNDAVQGLEVLGRGIGSFELDAISIGKGHEDGGDAEGVEFTKKEVGVEIDEGEHLFQEVADLFFVVHDVCFKFLFCQHCNVLYALSSVAGNGAHLIALRHRIDTEVGRREGQQLRQFALMAVPDDAGVRLAQGRAVHAGGIVPGLTQTPMHGLEDVLGTVAVAVADDGDGVAAE